jgi:uracil-DNA glycosylase
MRDLATDEIDKVENHLISALGEDWFKLLYKEFNKQYMKDLMHFIAERREQVNVYPPKGEVFNAYKLTPFEKVKVCIMGQDFK